ncbi:ABC transporter ATP-binding protein [Bradyrhizobium diazoefficiens]|nr:ABC transporter ATP-binding protein [Bradyrhizobium diazoefficiens]QQO20602.1 ABC transporter ATP-binding protein [Bradyrhizobium diazoefficiens]
MIAYGAAIERDTCARDEGHSEPLLDVRDLRITFSTREGVINAVNGASFEVRRGEIVALVGESGCGKSATALSLLRLIPHPPGRIADGEILFEGSDLCKMSSKQVEAIRGDRIAMIFQEPMTSLNPVHTIGRQVGEPLRVHRNASADDALARAAELLAGVNISDSAARMRNYPHQFSGGMRQRVTIAMGMGCKPDLIVADEPTTALDVTVQAQVLELLRQQVDENNSAMLIITHNLGVVAQYADRVYVMYAGRIVESATAYELYSAPRHPYTVGLLGSVPRLDQPAVERLSEIPGQPPKPLDALLGCPFQPRCPRAIDRCRNEMPQLKAVSPTHNRACWVA